MTAKIICIVVAAVVVVALMFMADRFIPRNDDSSPEDKTGN